MMLMRLNVSYCPDILRPAPIIADEVWLGSGAMDILCTHCGSIKRSRYPQPCDVILAEPPEDQPFGPVQGLGALIFRKDLMETIRPHLQGFAFGRCFVAGGSQEIEYVTCYCPRYIILRGNRQSRYSTCPSCGTILSTLGNAPEYVLDYQLEGCSAYQDAMGYIYFAEEVLIQLDLSDWYDTYLEAVPIATEPSDGQPMRIK